MKENPTTELLARFKEEFPHLYDKEGAVGSITKKHEAFLLTHTVSKKEVARVIEGMRAEEYTSPASNLGGASHNEGYNRALNNLSKALHLTEEA